MKERGVKGVIVKQEKVVRKERKKEERKKAHGSLCECRFDLETGTLLSSLLPARYSFAHTLINPLAAPKNSLDTQCNRG